MNNSKDATKDQELPTWILKLNFHAHQPPKVADWLVRVMTTGMRMPGHVNAEIIPPSAVNAPEWTLLQRFEKMEHIAEWQGGSALHRLLEEIVPLLDQNMLEMSQFQMEHYAATSNVATAIITHVKPGKEEEYRNWVAQIHTAQTNAPGYQGTFVQPPAPGTKAPWITLLRFDSPAALDQWFSSDVRKRLLSEAEHLLRYDLMALTSAFPGWFPRDPLTGKTPPRFKTAMLVLLVLFPVIVLQREIVPPLLAPLGPSLSLFLGLTVSVCLISLVLMPLAIKLFNFWLFPTGVNPTKDNIRGYVAILCLYAAMVGISTMLKFK
ncbi:MAG: hypothetical protein SGJ27_25385 [Candidatus Melainabacteria bacterium]|nr:hypothetical protein [Candidatus Melainabacteria bacterium]